MCGEGVPLVCAFPLTESLTELYTISIIDSKSFADVARWLSVPHFLLASTPLLLEFDTALFNFLSLFYHRFLVKSD